jgi:membrane protein implicated in regulation of membrane protease activity
MTNPFTALNGIEPWHWWALGAMLIVLEMLTPTFYFLWPGISAALVGLILILVPGLSFQGQIFLFALLSVVSTVLWKRYAPRDWLSTEPHPTLNSRAVQYIGRRGRAGDFTAGRGAIWIDDTRWAAESVDGTDPANGEMVMVVGTDGSVLRVAKATAS